MPDAVSALDLEPSLDFKFTDGALNGLDALAGSNGNRLIGRPRLRGVAVQMRGDDVERHGPGAIAQILVAAQLLKPLQLHFPERSHVAHANLQTAEARSFLTDGEEVRVFRLAPRLAAHKWS